MGPLTLITVLLVGLGAAQGLRFVKASKAARTAGWSLILIVVFWVWYMVAADYGYGAVSGTYTLRSEGESSTLVLQRDRSFQQELSDAGRNVRSQGTWRRVGKGGIAFSKDFLTLDQEVLPGGQVYAEVRKGFAGILVSTIEFGPEGKGPVFRRRWLR
jgi:hypothetical protein